MADTFDPDKYLAEKTAQPKAVQQGSAEAFDPDKYLAEKGASAPEEKSMGRRILEGAGRVLDYPGGLLRTGLASAAGQLTGNRQVVEPEDVTNAFKGKAPPSSEYLKRMGLDEGPSAELPLLGHTSARDAEGFALDVATDPMSLVAKGVKYLRPAGEAAEAAGRSIYKSGLKKVDERLAEKGTAPISDILMQEGKAGSTKQLLNDTREIGSDLGKERQALYSKADQSGVKVDMGQPLTRTEGLLSKMRDDPGMAPTAGQLGEMLERYKQAGPVPISKLSDWKTNLYNALPESAYANGKLKGPAKQFQKALAADFKDAIQEGGNKAEAGLGDQINQINDKWGSVIQADRPLAMQVRRGETPNVISSVDAILAGAGHPGILAAKKLADVSKTTFARTHGGLGLIKAGQSGAIDAASRRGLINSQMDDQDELDEQRQKKKMPQLSSR